MERLQVPFSIDLKKRIFIVINIKQNLENQIEDIVITQNYFLLQHDGVVDIVNLSLSFYMNLANFPIKKHQLYLLKLSE